MNVFTSTQLPSQWIAFRLGHLGDVVLCAGVLSHLAEKRGWSFAFVTRAEFADVFKYNPHVRETVALDGQKLGAGAFARAGRELASEYKGWGLLDLHGSLRSRALATVWKGPVARYRKLSFERRLFLWSEGRLFGELLRSHSVTQRYLASVETEMPPAGLLLPKIWIADAERESAVAKLDLLYGKGVRPVALHPYATHRLKAWPEGHWKGLVAILEKQGIPWLVIGRGKSFFSGDVRDLSNATNLRESCAILAECRALVSGDSGPMHLAAAVGTPVVALFGPTTREWGFFPAGPADIVLEKQLPCRPCSLHGRTPCKRGGECLASITPGEVAGAMACLL